MFVSTRILVGTLKSVIELLSLRIGRASERNPLVQPCQESLRRGTAEPLLIARFLSPFLPLALFVRQKRHHYGSLFRHVPGPLRELHLAVAIDALDGQHGRHDFPPSLESLSILPSLVT